MAGNSKTITSKQISGYPALNKWLFDGSSTTLIPQEVIDDKGIGSHNLLYFFSGTKQGIYISKYFNNFGIYQLDKVQVLEMMKDIIQRTAYIPKFKKKFRDPKANIFKHLWRKYPYFKPDDINLLTNKLEEMDCRDAVYEMFGIEKPKKVKEKQTSKKPKKQEKSKDDKSWDSVLNNFELVKE